MVIYGSDVERGAEIHQCIIQGKAKLLKDLEGLKDLDLDNRLSSKRLTGPIKGNVPENVHWFIHYQCH